MMRISKEEFVKRLLPLFLEPKLIHNDPLNAKPEELLKDDYDMIREAGLIILDEAELRRLLQDFPKEKDSQDYEKGCNASFLMYSYAEIQMWLRKLKEILGEETSEE